MNQAELGCRLRLVRVSGRLSSSCIGGHALVAMHCKWEACMQCEEAVHLPTLLCVDRLWFLGGCNDVPCPTSGVPHAVLCKLYDTLLHPRVVGSFPEPD